MAAPRDGDSLVIGLDSSTQSAKALACDLAGNILAEGRAPIPLASPQPGYAEQDVEDWWRAATTALSQVSQQVDTRRVAGLAISNQRETTAFLDADGQGIHPALLWLDERGESEIATVAQAFGRDALHAITGKPVDMTPALYRLAWMRRHRPEVLDRSARILDVQGFLVWRLAGEPATSWTSADPFALFDIRDKRWSEPILAHLGLSPQRLAPAHRPATRLGEVRAEAAAATGLPPGTPIFAGGGDGQCAGLGVDAARPGRVYLNLGTAIITGIWSEHCAIDRYWRTMISPTGEGYFLESCQRAGAFLVNWLLETLLGSHDGVDFERLEEAAASLPIGSEGLLLCPYLIGCMDPHWDPEARAAFIGLSGNHRPGHLYRATLEGLTLEVARAIAAMIAAGIPAREIVAIGGGAKSALWRQIVADATGLPVLTGRTVDASAVGAAMSAAVGAGLFDGFAEAARAMSSLEAVTEPNPEVAAQYRALSDLQGEVYRCNAEIFSRLKPLRLATRTGS